MSEFDESKHPRSQDGKFTSSGSSSDSKQTKTKYVDGVKSNKPPKSSFRDGKDPSEVVENKIPQESLHSLAKYKESSQFLNSQLRSSGKKTEQAKEISRAIQNSKLKEDIIVYRAIDSTDLKNPSVGDVIEDKGFMSTSTSKEMVEDFADHAGYKTHLVITAKAGTPAVNMDKILDSPKELETSINYEQKEILFDSGSKLKITNIRRDGNKTVINAEMIKEIKKGVYMEQISKNQPSGSSVYVPATEWELMKQALPGGHIYDESKFDQAELERGTKHELEHTTDLVIAREIAMDHLAEDSDYYKKLEASEKLLKKVKKNDDTVAHKFIKLFAKVILGIVEEEEKEEEEYAIPGEKLYPMSTIEAAMKSLADVSQFGNVAQQEQAMGAIYQKYPSLKNQTNMPKGVNKADRRVATVAVKLGSKLLMGVRRDNGKWTMPGGHLEENEDFPQGAKRELLEEAGIESDKLEPISEPTTVREGLTVQAFKLDLDEKVQTSMKEDPDAEVKRWQWIDCSNGMPENIKANMHTPYDNNILIKALGMHESNVLKEYDVLPDDILLALEALDQRQTVCKHVPIVKIDKAKQIVYGVVLAPDEVDAQEDIMEADEIEKAAHRYLSKSRVVGSNHEKPILAEPVESFIAPQDLEMSGAYGNQKVKKGSWVLGVKINDPDEWQRVESGDYTGFSVGGVGVRD